MKLKKLIIKHKGNCIFNYKDDYHNKEIYSTIIIGKNGSGKSFFLKNISRLFLYLESQKNKLIYEDYYFEYEMNGNIYSGKIENKIEKYYINNKEISIKEIVLPKKIIAISQSIDDKFTARQNSIDSHYVYEGERKTNAIFIGNMEKNIISKILTTTLKDTFKNFIPELLDFIGYTFPVKFEFNISNGISIEKDLNITFDRNPKTESMTVMNKYSLIEDNFKIRDFLSTHYNMENKKIEIFLEKLSISDKKLLLLSIKYGIVNKGKIKLKKNEDILFSDMSHGEKQVLSTFLKISENIENNSLILIDEPELGLHPIWQQQYITKLKSLFNMYSGIHIIIATHSHFFVADLEESTSSLFKIDNLKERSQLKEITFNTFGWSAESILLDVFGMRTTRNIYFQELVSKMIYLIENQSTNISEIKELYNRLSSHVLNENDPLNEILKEVNIYVNQNH